MKFKNTKRSSWLWLGLLCVFWGGMANGEKLGKGSFPSLDPGAQQPARFSTSGTVGNCSSTEGSDCIEASRTWTPANVLKDSINYGKGRYSSATGGTRYGLEFDTFYLGRDYLNHFKYLSANSSAGCTDGNCCPATSETISWILLRGKSPHPNGSFPGDTTSSSNAVAGVFTYNPSATAPSSYKLSGDKRYSLSDLTTNNSTIYRAPGRVASEVENSCSESFWRGDASAEEASNQPFGRLLAIQFGKNLRMIRQIGNGDPYLAVGVPGASALTSEGMSAKSENVFGGLYTNFGGNRSDYQTQRNILLVPDAAGTTFTIKEVSDPNSPLTNTTIGTLTCTTLNSPSNGFCRGTLTLTAVPGETGEATCLVAYGIGDTCENTLFCSAQEPTTNDRNLKTLTTIVASTPVKGSVTVTAEPKWESNGGPTPEVCATLTNQNAFPVSTLTITESLTDGWTTPTLSGSNNGAFSTSASNTCGGSLAPFESCKFCTQNSSIGNNTIKAHAVYVEVPSNCSGTSEKEVIAMAGKGVSAISLAEKAPTGGKPAVIVEFENGAKTVLGENIVDDFATCTTEAGMTSCALAGEGAPAAASREVAYIAGETYCFDGVDDDSDGLTDCADTDCDGLIASGTNDSSVCSFGTETDCTDSVDNDGDGVADCDDADCAASGSCPEALCMDGADNDTDTYTDCADTDCNSDWSVSAAGEGRCEFGTESSCRDNFDNDADGNADCLDSNCSTDFACMTLSIDSNPSDETIACGDPVTFTCSALASGTTATYQWQKSTDGGSTWIDIAGATSSTYTEVDGQTGDKYRCIATPDNCSLDGWVQEAYLKAANNNVNDVWGDEFGRNVAISGDTIVVGAISEDSNQTTITNGATADTNNSLSASGAAYVYKRTGSEWAQEAYLKASNASSADYFGNSVSISGDTIVVGAYREDSSETTITNGTTSAGAGATDSGAAYIFKRNAGSWSQEAYLKASNSGSSDEFGTSVSVSGDTVVVGAIDEDSNQTTITNGTTSAGGGLTDPGAAYVFKRTGSTWSQEAYLKASNPSGSDFFGWSVSASGNTIVVGAIYEDSSETTITNGTTSAATGASDSGAAYVFKRSGSTWSQEAYLKAPNAGVGDYFGHALAVSGDTIVVGAYKEDSNQATITNGTTASSDNSLENPGAAYVFKRSGSTWTNEAFLKPPYPDWYSTGDWEVGDEFGYSVAIDGDRIVVGAHQEGSNQRTITNGTTYTENDSRKESGAAFVFKRLSGNWSLEAYLKASNGDVDDFYGRSVAISGDTIVVGAPGEDSNQTTITNGTTSSSDNSNYTSGAAYVYRRSYCADSATSTAATLTVGACVESLCFDKSDNDTDGPIDCSDGDCTATCESECCNDSDPDSPICNREGKCCYRGPDGTDFEATCDCGPYVDTPYGSVCSGSDLGS